MLDHLRLRAHDDAFKRDDRPRSTVGFGHERRWQHLSKQARKRRAILNRQPLQIPNHPLLASSVLCCSQNGLFQCQGDLVLRSWWTTCARTRSAMHALLKLALSIAVDNTPLFNQISATSIKPAHLIALKLRPLQWYINFHFVLS